MVPKYILDIYKTGNYIKRTFLLKYNYSKSKKPEIYLIKKLYKDKYIHEDTCGNYFNIDAINCKTNVTFLTSTMYFYKGKDEYYSDELLSESEALACLI